MSDLVLAAAAPTFVNASTVPALITQINALLVGLLSNTINGISYEADEQVGATGNGYNLTISYNNTGTTITTPYVAKGFVGRDAPAVAKAVQDFMTANPSYFFSAVFTQQLHSQLTNEQASAILFYNTGAAAGAANWAASGGASAASNIGAAWNPGYTNPAASIVGVAYGNGLYVTITSTSTMPAVIGVWTSPDGLTWTPRRGAVPAAAWSTISFGNGKFIAAAAGIFASSTDGITWTPYVASSLSALLPSALLFANSTWVMTFSNSTSVIAYSADGITWSTTTYTAGNPLLSLAYGAGLFVAVGSGASGFNVMTSPDGITWTTRPGVNTAMQGVAYSSSLGLFAAVGTNFVTTSPDGITWTTRAAASAATWFGVVWDATNSLFISANNNGASNQIMTSPDGITWTIRATDSAVAGWKYLTTNAGVTVGGLAAASTPGNILRSADGVTWNARSANGDLTWNAVAYGAGLYVAVASTGIGNRVMTSPDGVVWTPRTSAADNAWYGVAYSASLGLFVAVSDTGTGNRVMTSPDGITWTIRVSASDKAWRAVVWGEAAGVFVATSITGATFDNVMTSPDGITWTLRTVPVSGSWPSVAYGNGLFVAACITSLTPIMTSPDGINWTARAVAIGGMASGAHVVFGNGLFLYGMFAGGQFYPYYSTDGITWVIGTNGATAAGVVGYGSGHWVLFAAAGGNVQISVDGKTWRPVASLTVTGTIPVGGTAYGTPGLVVINNTNTAGVRAMVSPP